ncbi:TIGR00297 family protein [Methanohalophilus sp.]|uniref:TIGR00297 family protein n=1 Tax=Methanohalophilus sp. TaxID=1966352 RepID=UPI002637831B|nr:TIGR00297 family protein [Methanohalophilus sp.]
MSEATPCLQEAFSKNKNVKILSFAIILLILFPYIGSLPLTLLFLALTLTSKTVLSKVIGEYYYLFLAITILFVIDLISQQLEYSFPDYIIIQSLEISSIGLMVAKTIRENGNLNRNHHSLPSSICLLLAGGIVAAIAGGWSLYCNGESGYEIMLFTAIIGAIMAALFESIPSEFDKMLSMTLGSAMAMWVLVSFGYSISPLHLLFAFIFSLSFGYLAYITKIADISAVMSSTLMGVLIIVFSNILWYVLLLTFFILGGMFTRYRYEYKLSKGLAQEKGGIRSYENVFSNSTAALAFAIAYGIYPQHAELISYAYLGTVATATADTLASEIGTTAKQTPRMITNLKPTKSGTDGAITVLGEMAAIGGACVIAILATVFGMTENIYYAIIFTCVGGFVGTNIDSLLGGTLQKRGYLSNSGVNFYATLAGGLFSGLAYLLIA